MGLGYARGVLDLHRGIFDSFRGRLRRLLSKCVRWEVVSRLGRRRWAEQGPRDTRDFLLGSFFTYEHGGACFLL